MQDSYVCRRNRTVNFYFMRGWGNAIIKVTSIIIKFCGDLADQPVSVVVQEGCWKIEVPGPWILSFKKKHFNANVGTTPSAATNCAQKRKRFRRCPIVAVKDRDTIGDTLRGQVARATVCLV